MGFFDELKKLTRPYEEEDEDFLDEMDDLAEEPAPEKPRANPFAGFSFGGDKAESEHKAPAAAAPAAPARSLRQSSAKTAAPLAADTKPDVIIARPDRFEVAAELADHLAARKVVIMNLETTAKETSRRLIDFLSGVTYAQGGKIKKAGSNTYIITPPSVNLMGEQMDELESTGFYF